MEMIQVQNYNFINASKRIRFSPTINTMLNQNTKKQCIQSLIKKDNQEIWKEFQSILIKKAERVLEQECCERLDEILKNIDNKQEGWMRYVEKLFWLLLQEIQALTQSKQQQSMNHIDRTIERTDYHILQESLQKAQSEVRKHIRIEQQLKLYLDGVEQKNQQLQKQLKIEEQKYLQLFEAVKLFDSQKKQFLRKIKKLEERTKFTHQKDISNHTKLKPYKSVKLITEQLSRVDHSMSMYKSRPTFTNHLHSKSKFSDKSSEKQHKQSKIINEKKNRMKQLDDMIQVNLSNDVHRDSHEQNNDDSFIPTQEDVRVFRQMTKTVQMKQAYKRPVRKITKYKTESNHGKDLKDLKESKHNNTQNGQSECRQFRSVSMCK